MHEMYFDSLAVAGVFHLHLPGVCSAAPSWAIFFFVLGTLFGLFSQLLFRTFKPFMPVTDSTVKTLLKLSEVQQITENFPGAIFRYYQPMRSKVGSGRFHYISKGLFDLYGIAPDRADPAYIHSLIHPDDLSEFEASVVLNAQIGNSWYKQWRIITPAGAVKWIEGKATVKEIQRDGTRVWDGVLVDITEMSNARIEAERASRSKDEFLSVISHELKTPLTPVWGWLNLLLAKKEQVDTQTLDRGLTTIQHHVEKHIGTIEQLLDASRIVCDKISLSYSQFDFSALVRDAVEQMLVALAQESRNPKTILLEVCQGDFTCIGDFKRLHQVVTELLSNAVKFTPEDGRIDIFLDNKEEFICLDIADTGSGISPEFLPVCFHFFSHEDSPDTRSTGGLGLGLPIVRHLVELHGGTITADSAGTGKGSIFSLKLPSVTAINAP